MRMTIKQAIHVLHLPCDHLRNYDEYGIGIDDELQEAMQMAKVALREKAEREDHKPLTLEELWQMNGEAVWLEILNGGEFWLPDDSTWAEVKAHKFQKGVEFWLFGSEEELDPNNENYGKTWICYRHKPKEVQGDV